MPRKSAGKLLDLSNQDNPGPAVIGMSLRSGRTVRFKRTDQAGRQFSIIRSCAWLCGGPAGLMQKKHPSKIDAQASFGVGRYDSIPPGTLGCHMMWDKAPGGKIELFCDTCLMPHCCLERKRKSDDNPGPG